MVIWYPARSSRKVVVPSSCKVSVLPAVMGSGVAVEVGWEVGMRVGVGCDCSVSAMAATTVSATMVSRRPGSVVGAKRGGAVGVESPGMTQAVTVTRRISAKKDVFLWVMDSFLFAKIKKPPGYYSREASGCFRALDGSLSFCDHIRKIGAFQPAHQFLLCITPYWAQGA